jgi:imidazolonepropionase-like amidohydrolase
MVTPEELQRLQEEGGARLRRLREFLERAKRYAEARENGAENLFDPRLEAMRPYMKGKLPVIFHTNSAQGIRTALQISEQFGLKAIIAGARDAWKVADLLAKKKVPVIVGPLWTLPANDYDPYDAPWANAAVLHRAGVKIAFQSSSAATARDLPYQAGVACAFGLPQDEALRALTINAAEILGVADQLGSIEVGKLANLIVTDSDPLEIVTNVHYLFIAGKPIPLESRHTRLYLQYRQRLNQTKPSVAQQPAS